MWEELKMGPALSSKLGTSAVSVPVCLFIPKYIYLIGNSDGRGAKAANTILEKLCTKIFKGIGISPVFCSSRDLI